MSSITVTLPDGNTLDFESGATVLDVAEKIGPGLAKAALAGRIGGKIVDLRRPLTEDTALEIVTTRDATGGDVIRHSAEHVMADAVKRLFPSAQVDAGRSDHSEKFQYDFLVDEPFTQADLERIEEESGDILIVNLWQGNAKLMPALARAFVTKSMTTWKDHAHWPRDERIVRWRFEPKRFQKLV